MQNLINELMQPGLTATNEIIPVSTVKRRAAERLVQLTQMYAQDHEARLQLEKQVNGISKEEMLEAVSAAMNAEHEAAFG